MAADLASGFSAGVALCVVGHPFDTLKVLMQLQPATYPTVLTALRATVAKHGLGGLYRGVGSPLVGNGLYNAVQFAVFARLKALATDGGKKVTLGRIAAASALTGLAVAFVEGPQDLFKSQVQAQMAAGASAPAAAGGAPARPRFTGTLDCARTIIRERGP
jgi:solute carrier family 25 carnitine/acylcarnitine transporter 20/29